MINFAIGPVQSNESVRKKGGEQVPYFRTPEFSELMFENERLVKQLAQSSDDSKTVFITGSGTAAMEAVVANTLTKNDRAIIVNGGSFGQRFVDLCRMYEIPYTEIKLNFGESLKEEQLNEFDNKDYTAFLVNVCETSSGIHYDMDLISNFCKRNSLFLITDNISSFLADSFNMKKLNVDVMITGSQKALACPPGVSIVILSNQAIDRVYNNDLKCMYLNIKLLLENMKRGQTPFTPAVGILIQINERLKEIEKNGGASFEIRKAEKLANYFRNKVNDIPLKYNSESCSNAVTAVYPVKENAYEIFSILKEEYGIWVCPNGGIFKDKVFRVGHIGELSIQDYDELINALKDLNKRGIL